jgi:Epoxide hydrolase N terminus
MLFRETRWPDEYQNSNRDTGTDKTYLKALLEYWASGYGWRAQEAKLNCLTLFVARIGNNDIHFVHAVRRPLRSAGATGTPRKGYPRVFPIEPDGRLEPIWIFDRAAAAIGMLQE